jgi:hypothetical protein
LTSIDGVAFDHAWEKKIVVAQCLLFEEVFKKNGFNEGSYKAYIQRKVLNQDTIDIKLINYEYLKSRIISQKAVDMYFNDMSIDEIVRKYFRNNMKIETGQGSDFNNALIYKLFTQRILVIDECEDGGLIMNATYRKVSSNLR